MPGSYEGLSCRSACRPVAGATSCIGVSGSRRGERMTRCGVCFTGISTRWRTTYERRWRHEIQPHRAGDRDTGTAGLVAFSVLRLGCTAVLDLPVAARAGRAAAAIAAKLASQLTGVFKGTGRVFERRLLVSTRKPNFWTVAWSLRGQAKPQLHTVPITSFVPNPLRLFTTVFGAVASRTAWLRSVVDPRRRP